MADAPWEFWIDVGGTFTDTLARAPDGNFRRLKLLSSGVTKGRVEAGSSTLIPLLPPVQILASIRNSVGTMIRRNLTDENGVTRWLLISQVEHARISGEITSAWHEPFSAEVVDAITHHDDGWAQWEAAPQIDPTRGRPLSFLENSIADAIRIWSDSIAAGRRIGPLAGAIVAGHFLGLASGSDHAVHPLAQTWLREMSGKRAAWLAEWGSASPANTPAIAERGQQMLLTADLLSLWLTMNGPVTNVDAAAIPNAEMQSRSSTVLGRYQFIAQAESAHDAEIAWQGSLSPWPFAVEVLNLESPALAVPVAKYQSWPEIAATSRPICLRWLLRQTLPTSGEC